MVPWVEAPFSPVLPSLQTHHSLLGLDEGPAEAVHFGVEPTGVAQVVSGAVPPPQRGLDGAAVDALPALGQVLQQLWGQEQRGEAMGTAAEPGIAPLSAAPAPPRRNPGPGRASTRPSENQFPGSDGGHAVIFFFFLNRILGFFFSLLGYFFFIFI